MLIVNIDSWARYIRFVFMSEEKLQDNRNINNKLHFIQKTFTNSFKQQLIKIDMKAMRNCLESERRMKEKEAKTIKSSPSLRAGGI